jgi:limonene-1,2-epoxide hydrolase
MSKADHQQNVFDGEGASTEREKWPTMQRGVSQLLFNYLPQRTVDWEDGLAIVQLGTVRLSASWDEDQKTVLLNEMAELFDRWRAKGGMIDREFPDPRHEPERYTIGLPSAIAASVLSTALICQACGQLVFSKKKGDSSSPLICSHCEKPRVRQLPFVFVHGCGDLIPITEWLPFTKQNAAGELEPVNLPLKCPECKSNENLYMPGRSDRVKDMKVLCRKCKVQVIDRLKARCHRCLKTISKANKEAASDTVGGELVSRLIMRLARYSASETYYPQGISILRLDRPKISTGVDEVSNVLRTLLPEGGEARLAASAGDTMKVLTERLQAAERLGDAEEAKRWMDKIFEVASGKPAQVARPSNRVLRAPTAPDIGKGLHESIAFRETVTTRSAIEMASTTGLKND